MDISRYTTASPGQLVPTTGNHWLSEGGRPVVQNFTGHAFVPAELPPKLDWERMLGRLSRGLLDATSAASQLSGVAQTLPNPHLLSRPFGIREAQASSRIENTVAAARDIVLEDKEQSVGTESREVANYLHALDGAMKSEHPIGEWLLRSMHRSLLVGTRGEDKRPGEYRSGQAFIRGDASEAFENARFVPPPPERVQECMTELERFIRQPPDDLPPLVVIALAHYQFETIHPFADGNGRIGRMLIALQLCRDGIMPRPLIYLSAYFDRHRDMYYDLLRSVSETGDFESWIRFFCEGVRVQSLDAIERANRLIELRREYISRVTTSRAAANLRELVDWMFTRPAFAIRDAAEHLGLTPQQASRHVKSLEGSGLITEITGGTYGRVWLAHEIIQAVELESISGVRP